MASVTGFRMPSMFENDNPWLSVLILGTNKNHKVTNLENEEPTEEQECTFSTEIH
jgi:hypothetical protein